MSEDRIEGMVHAGLWAERPNGNWGGTLKEEMEAQLILKVIRQKCLQHLGKCRYCPYWCKNSESCFFDGKVERGLELYDFYESRGIL